MSIKLSSWQDYWKLFDELIDSLIVDDKSEIMRELREAQKYVNGLTDGWFDFKKAFEKCVSANKDKMSAKQIEISEFLIDTLEKSLNNR